MSKPIFIAEIKTRSPFGFQSPHSFSTLMDYAIEHGDWVSVHTNALWGGDFDAISFVRRCTDKPILAKGIHGTDDDIQRALDHGANYVLVVDRLPNNFRVSWEKCIFEIHDLDWFERGVAASSLWKEQKFVANTRDLKTGLSKKMLELDRYITKGVWTCQASGIRIPDDVHPNVNAFIVGEHLINFCETLKASAENTDLCTCRLPVCVCWHDEK